MYTGVGGQPQVICRNELVMIKENLIVFYQFHLIYLVFQGERLLCLLFRAAYTTEIFYIILLNFRNVIYEQ